MQFQNYFQGALHECPYEVGPVRIVNFTDTYGQHMDELDKKGQLTPADIREYALRGDFRVKLSIGTPNDPRAYDLMMVLSINFRQADTF